MKRANARQRGRGGGGEGGRLSVSCQQHGLIGHHALPSVPLPGMCRNGESDGASGGGSSGGEHTSGEPKQRGAASVDGLARVIYCIANWPHCPRIKRGGWKEAHPARATRTCTLHRLRKQLSRPAGLLHVTRGFDLQP